MIGTITGRSGRSDSILSKKAERGLQDLEERDMVRNKKAGNLATGSEVAGAIGAAAKATATIASAIPGGSAVAGVADVVNMLADGAQAGFGAGSAAVQGDTTGAITAGVSGAASVATSAVSMAGKPDKAIKEAKGLAKDGVKSAKKAFKAGDVGRDAIRDARRDGRSLISNTRQSVRDSKKG